MSESQDINARIEYLDKVLWELAAAQVKKSLRLESEFKRIVSVVAKVLGMDRSSIWLFSDHEQKRLDCITLYNLPDQYYETDLASFSAEQAVFFSDCAIQRQAFEIAKFESNSLPGVIDKYFLKYKIKSFLSFPIYLGSTLKGIISLESLDDKYCWSGLDLSFISSIADLLNQALANHEREKTVSFIEAGLETGSQAALVVGLDGRIKKVNYKAERIFGFSQEELSRLHIEQLLPDVFSQETGVISRLFKQYGEKTTNSDEYHDLDARHKTGRYFPVGCTVSRILQWGEPHALILLSDLSEKVEFAQQLKESEEMYRNIVECQQDLVIRAGSDGAITFVNNSFCHYVQQKVEDVTGRHIFEFMPKEDLLIVQEAVESMSPDQPVSEYTHRVFLPNGQYGIFNWRLRAFFNKDGQIQEFQAIGRDVSSEHNERGRLRQTQRLESLAVLSGGMAHEFNNILTPVLSLTDMVMTSLADDAPQQELLQHVFDASNRAKDLVKKVLVFSRSEEDKERKPIDAGHYLAEVISFIEKITPARINFNSNIDLASGHLLANPSDLYQILSNLCSNAVHAMTGEGHLSVECSSEEYKGEPSLKIEVSDTGKGVAPEFFDQLYEPFFTTKVIGQGTGLGLAIVSSMVEELEGHIFCDSEVGKGTKFTVYLPLTFIKEEVQSKAEGSESLFGRERILVVDDEENIAQMVKDGLSKLGYSVHMCTSVNAALSTFKEQSEEFDVLLSDFTMPIMTGVELAWHIRRVRPNFPVVIMSGYGQLISKEELKAGSIDYLLQKPFVIDDLARLLRLVFAETKVSPVPI